MPVPDYAQSSACDPGSMEMRAQARENLPSLRKREFISTENPWTVLGNIARNCLSHKGKREIPDSRFQHRLPREAGRPHRESA